MSARGGRRLLWRQSLLFAALAVYLLPLLLMVLGSFKPDARVLAEAGTPSGFLPRDLDLQNYRDVFQRVAFTRLFLNSLLVTGLITVGSLAINAAAGYALARLRWRGRGLAMTGVLALLVVPLEAFVVPLFTVVGRLGLRDTYAAQVLPFLADAFTIYLFASFFRDLPRELEDAARVDGAGALSTFLRIILPNARPALAAAALVTWLFRWGAYLWPLLVTVGPRVRPLPVGLAAFYTLPPLQWGDILAFGVLMVLPILLLFLFGQRYLVAGLAGGALKE